VQLRRPDPQDVVIVGVSGDLARRKLIPALYDLAYDRLTPVDGRIIGYASREWDDDYLRQVARESVQRFSRRRDGLDERVWDQFSSRLHYVRSTHGGYARVADLCSSGERLIYLAVPPAALHGVITSLGTAGLVAGTRVIIEKPFGSDVESARALSRTVHETFDESQVYRIDHYLGKETVQNILAFRFANSMFERVWNRDAIDHVQITMAESIGVEGRGGFYEEVGALRDVVQNHVLQMLALVAMEPPVSMAPNAIRDEKAKVLHATRPLGANRTVRGQYTAGDVAGQLVPGYREEPGVDPNSLTETFFAAEVEVDTWRWAGVPFYLRAGKRLPRRSTQVAVVFREAPLSFFDEAGVEEMRPNRLIIRIQPDEGIEFGFMAKQPGPEVYLQRVGMDFSYKTSFMTEPAEAYERLLYDAMQGDHTLFLRDDSVLRSWALVQPALDAPAPLSFYPAGTWGPPEADRLIAPRRWALR